MKIIDTTQDSASSWSPFTTGSKAFMQNAYVQMGDVIINSILNNSYTGGTCVILQGCINSGSGSNYIISSGWVYYNSAANIAAGIPGQIYYVTATTFTAAGGQTAVATITKTSDTSVTNLINNTLITNCDPTNFSDNTPKSIHDIYTITIASGVSGSGISDFSSFVNYKTVLNPVFAQILTTTFAVTSGGVTIGGGTTNFTTVFDADSLLNNSNGHFTPKAGYYKVSCIVGGLSTSTSGGAQVTLALYKNGSLVKNTAIETLENTSINRCLQFNNYIIDANGTDYYTIVIYTNASVTLTCNDINLILEAVNT